jgi:hypothetical protein
VRDDRDDRNDRDPRKESAFKRMRAALRPGGDPALPVSVASIVCLLVASVAVARADVLAQSLESVTEEARFRSACAASGEQILAANFIRSAVHQEQFARYSPQTSRCYVEMRVHTVDRNELDHNEYVERFGRFLYDGQTKELLAFAQIKDGKKSGRVFDLNHRTTSFENGGWDDATEYIHAMMMDDR